jgi:hypothetical protein
VPSTFTGVTCAVIAASAANTWTVTITAAANAALRGPLGLNALSTETRGGIAAVALLLAILLLCVVACNPMEARQRRLAGVVQRPLWPLAGVLTLLCLGMLAAGCGVAPKASSTSSGSTSATPSAAAVTVQGTANGISHSVQIGVTVN